MREINFGPYSVNVSSLDKVLFPKENLTKGDLINFYTKILDFILPHLKNRPVTMQRFPDGIAAEGFYEKKLPVYFPDWIDKVKVDLKKGETQYQLVCNNKATLVYLANQACITPHIWNSKKDNLEYPDKLVFDLDPPKDSFNPVRSGALSLKEFFDNLEINSYVMTTGSTGVHVVVFLDEKTKFDIVRQFAQKVANFLAKKNPDKFTNETRKAKRKGRLYIDSLRNSYGQTCVCPYAVRPRFGAPVATPLEWRELEDKNLTSTTYTMSNIFRRLGQINDPWANVYRHKYSVASMEKYFDSVD